jgi:hypothetical protein
VTWNLRPTANPALPANDTFSYPTFQTLKSQTQVLAGAFALRKLFKVDVEVDGRSGLADGQLVSGNYFTVLGVGAAQPGITLEMRTRWSGS